MNKQYRARTKICDANSGVLGQSGSGHWVLHTYSLPRSSTGKPSSWPRGDGGGVNRLRIHSAEPPRHLSATEISADIFFADIILKHGNILHEELM